MALSEKPGCNNLRRNELHQVRVYVTRHRRSARPPRRSSNHRRSIVLFVATERLAVFHEHQIPYECTDACGIEHTLRIAPLGL